MRIVYVDDAASVTLCEPETAAEKAEIGKSNLTATCVVINTVPIEAPTIADYDISMISNAYK